MNTFLFWLYKKVLEMTKERHFHFFGNRFYIGGSLSYNTSVTINLRTSNACFPRWSLYARFSYKYDYDGRRTGKIACDHSHYHYGVLDHVWHKVLDAQEKVAVIKERKGATD